MGRPLIDETGTKHGRLLVLRHVGKGLFACACDCGNATTVTGFKLRAGHTRSCGCYAAECIQAGANTSHGLRHTHSYDSYKSARHRCENPNNIMYPRYGGRGIKFLLPPIVDFARVMEPLWFERATLGRIDNDGHYEMSNVRWETYQQQSENKSSNVIIVHDGKEMLLRDWIKLIGIGHSSYYHHVNKGLDAPAIAALYLSGDISLK